MDILLSILNSWKATVLTAIFFYILYKASNTLLERQAKSHTDKSLIRSIILFMIGLIGIVAVILALPMSGEQRGQITSLIGIVLSAVLGLSSTTFIGNALAGIALKMRKSFKPGDFITVNEIFGRVTEQGLFHTEIQNVDRDLTSLPNMTLASNSVKVTRSSGTFISTECSLGYDVNRLKIEVALLAAAKNAGLEDAFVHIISLGDFSIVYRVNGLLKDVKSIVSAKSKLTGEVIDALHAANIEIVSPNFMNQRQLGTQVFIPKKHKTANKEILKDNKPENVIFDKADEAEGIEKRKELLQEVENKIKTDQQNIQATKDSAEKKILEEKLETTKVLKEKITARIEAKVEELDKK